MNKYYKQILSQIEQIAPFYAPKWKFNHENREPGSAIAHIFAKQLGGSLERFERMPFNHKLAFYNKLGSNALPAVPAKGIACFCLSGSEAGGALINKDFQLLSPPIGENKTRFSFITEEDIYVTPSKLDTVVYSDYERDIVSFWDNQSEPFSPLNNSVSVHSFIFGHDYIDRFDINSRLYLRPNCKQSALWIKKLCDENLVKWSLLSNGKEFDIISIADGERILLAGFPDCLNETSDFYDERRIKLEIFDITDFEKLPAPVFSLEITGEKYDPDSIYANGEEQTESRFYPFGKTYLPNNEAVFVCNSVLCQKGAKITVMLTVGFDIEETDELVLQMPPKKFIINKKDIKELVKPDIFIEYAVWEYWNGKGFSLLPLEKSAEKIFAGINEYKDIIKTQEYKLEFICPNDIAPFFVGAGEGYCIRARIREAANIFKRPARIFTPWIERVCFGFDAPVSDVKNGMLQNNFETECISEKPLFLFHRPLNNTPVLYLGFDKPLNGGTVNILVSCTGNKNNAPVAAWYICNDKELKTLYVRDGTNSFTETGIISFNINIEHKPCVKYGKEAWWICVSFSGSPHEFYISQIQINAAAIIQCDIVKNERHYLNNTDLIQLKSENIIDETLYLVEYDKNMNELKTKLKKSEYQINRAKGIINLQLKPPVGGAVQACYRFCSNSAVSINAGETFTPSAAAGYVNKAINPFPVSGGAEQENANETIIRIGKKLRHGNRSVTAEDYEDLLNEREIAAVKCFTGANGKITITILINDYDKPYAFADISKRAEDKLFQLYPVGINLPDICPPVFVTIKIKAEIQLLKMDCSEKVYAALHDICNPVISVKKLGFGILPDIRYVADALNAIPEIINYSHLFVHLSIGGKEIENISPHSLPISGEHSLVIKGV